MIDKQGRIFGKINVIDLVVIILIGIIIVIAGIKLFDLDDLQQKSQVEEGDVQITLEVSNVVASVENYISIGDKLIISNSFVDLKITSFEFEPEVDEKGKESATKVKGVIKVEGKAKKNEKGIYIDNFYFHVNSNINLVTDTFITVSKIYDLKFIPND